MAWVDLGDLGLIIERLEAQASACNRTRPPACVGAETPIRFGLTPDFR